jgi:hypothetical protein
MNKRERAQEQWKQLKWSVWHSDASRAVWDFGEYRLSILFGGLFYSDGVSDYEVAVLHGDRILYEDDLSDLGLPYNKDVYAHLPKDDVIDLAVILMED